MSSLAPFKAVATILAATFLSACSDGRESIAGLPAGSANGLYPQLVITGRTETVTGLQLSLLRKPAGTRLGSFQGELVYDASTLAFSGASLPDGVDGVANLVAPGKIRFVGTALDGVGDSPLVTLRFRRTGEVKPEGFAVSFEDVSASEDLSDLTPMVRPGPPLISIR